jgi:ubiquinone/menaquinone biosynthesis C-methylase UbiE
MKQVDKEAYQFSSYAHVGRFVSYYHQLDEVVKFGQKTVLEVGVGDGVFRDYIKNNTSIAYTSVDIAEDLHPDVVGSVTKLPFKDSAFDVVCAFEVLEHISFDQFEVAIHEIARVARCGAVLSLPHFGPPVQFFLKIPFLKPIQCSFKIPFARSHVFNGQHYWEVGKKGYSPRHIRNVLARSFIVEKEFVPFQNQYHHFYVLRKKS